jgi:hypothetical protein
VRDGFYASQHSSIPASGFAGLDKTFWLVLPAANIFLRIPM